MERWSRHAGDCSSWMLRTGGGSSWRGRGVQLGGSNFSRRRSWTHPRGWAVASDSYLWPPSPQIHDLWCLICEGECHRRGLRPDRRATRGRGARAVGGACLVSPCAPPEELWGLREKTTRREPRGRISSVRSLSKGKKKGKIAMPLVPYNNPPQKKVPYNNGFINFSINRVNR
jgi:hypothetical protein